MLDITPVSSVEYYREQNTDSRRETLQYHTDNETIERGHGLMGVWKIYGDASLTYSKAIVEGEAVKFEDLEALTRDENPDDGESYGIKRTAKSKTSARDLTLSAPKPWSILNGFSNAMVSLGGQDAELWATVAAITDEGHNLGIDAALNHAMSEEAFGVRFGQGGKDRAGATFVAAAKFDHFTSRDGDMQKHSHLVSPNLARAPDGSVRAWDNHKMSVLRGKLSALYRAEMVAYANDQFEKNGINIRFKKEGRNYTIVGLDPKIVDHFSKRRTAVLNEMYKNGYTDTKNNRKAAQVASYNSRRSKKELPPMPELFERWIFELKQLGYTPGSMLQAMNDAAIELDQKKEKVWDELKAKAVAEGVEIPAIRPDLDPLQVAKSAVKDITAMEAVFERAKFETTMIEHMQTVCNAETALATIERIKGEGSYVQVGVKGRSKEGVFTDSNTLMEEYEIMELERSMRGNTTAIPKHFIEEALAEGFDDGEGGCFYANKEQAALVYHLLSGSQRTDGIGDAGTGKTTTMKIVKLALDKASRYEVSQGREPYRLVVVAPTNKAVSGLAKEIGIPVEDAYSVTRFIMDAENGKLKLNSKTVAIGDEWGMVSRSDHLKMLQVSKAAGNRLPTVGDPKQLPPVQAGAPFRMVTEAWGAARLIEIARQEEAWARQASKDLASGNVKDGIMAYEDRGHLHILDSAEAVHDMAIDEVMAFEREEAGETLLISPTNAERRMLSRRLIEEKLDAGILTGDQYFYDHTDRGTDNVQNSLIMIGSVVALAESVTYKEERYPNNAVGKVTNIVSDGEGSEPYVTVKWDDGREVTFKPSHFVGYREEGDPLANVPKLAPADCLTLYQAQGLSFRNVVTPLTGPSSTQSIYVSGTRHRRNLVAIIDGSRIENDIANKEGKVFTMGKDGSSRQEDDVSEAVVTRAMILAKFIEECERTNSKANACDFLGGALKFHENYREHYDAKFKLTNDLYNPENRAEQKMESKPEAKTEGVEDGTPKMVRPPLPRGIGRESGAVFSAAAKELEEIAKRRTSAVAEPEIAKSPKIQNAKAKIAERVSKRLPTEELDAMVRYSLVDYFVDEHKFKYLESYNPKSGLQGHILHKDEVGKISVIQKGDGSWNWSMRDGSAYGVIWDYAVWRGATKGDAMRIVKEELGGSIYSAPRSIPRVAQVDEKPKTLADRIQLGGVKEYVSETYADMRKWVGSMMDRTMKYGRGVNPYLRDVRGIDVQTQRCFPGQIGTEASMGKKNPNGATFAHRDLEGNIWNVERKGIKQEGAKRSFSEMGPGTKRLGLLGDVQNPSRIYVSESIIDGVSLFQADGRPKGALIASTFGNPSDEGLHDLHELAKRNPGVEFHIAMDNDSAGRNFAAMVEDSVKLASGENASVVDRFPPEEFKDWNDQVRGIKVTAEDKAADEAKARSLAEDRAKAAALRESKQQPTAQEQRRPPMPPISKPQPPRWDRPVADPEAAEAYRKRQQKEAEERQQQKPKGQTM
ncbi:MobF family relaxase [Rhizobium ruizarguesonis]